MQSLTSAFYLRLGNSGLKGSKIILGVMSIGTLAWQPWVYDEVSSLKILEYGYKVSVNT